MQTAQTIGKGLIHLYTGEGKGKTTAALGLILRAHGYNKRIVMVQFFKGRETGELRTLAKLQGVTVFRYEQDFGFYQYADEQTQAEMTRLNNQFLREASRLVEAGCCDLLVLDEICAAYHSGAVDTALVDAYVMQKPDALELVLTGRNAPQHFITMADYVTEFVNRKHPYDRGIVARPGIEY